MVGAAAGTEVRRSVSGDGLGGPVEIVQVGPHQRDEALTARAAVGASREDAADELAFG